MDPSVPAVDPKKCTKTYGKADRTNLNPSKTSTSTLLQKPTLDNIAKWKDLTTKQALEFLLAGTLKSKVCRYCLKVAFPLSHLDQILHVSGKEVLYKVAIKDIIASFHPFKVIEDENFPDRICENCLDRAISSYLFTQQCEQAERALLNCFQDLDEKFLKLDPLERTKKRGRQKIHPNHNVLYAEHDKVINYAEPIINIIHKASEVLTEQSPISELECLKCCEVLPNLESLINHTKIHPKTMWFNCRLCGTSFPKYHHLKKHFNTKHKHISPTKPLETPRYDCKTCGLIFDKYYDYLQHIEKHKFKMVMEHLVERKMDKLCALCFDKGTKMVSLEEKICVHGGSPELTGERSLYSVLSSTLPENKNKYRELLIPTQARTIRFVKKKKEIHRAGDYSLSNPIVLSKEILDSYDFHSFFFSKPLLLNPTKIAGKDSSDNHEVLASYTEINASVPVDSEVDNDSVTLLPNEYSQIKTSDEPEEISYIFSNPDPVILFDDNKINFETNGNFQNLRKRHWVFDKCGEKNADIDEVVPTTDKNISNKIDHYNKASCKVCWVFKCLKKCEACGKRNEAINTDTTPDLTKTKQIKEKDLDIEKVMKIFTEDIEKPLTWQCDICLMHNKKDKKSCDCCDAKALFDRENDAKKVNLIKVSNNAPRTISDNMNHCKLPDLYVDEIKTTIDNKIETIDTIQIESKKDSSNLFISEMISYNNYIHTLHDEVSLMDIEMIEPDLADSNAMLSFKQCNLEAEAMDVQITESRSDVPYFQTNINLASFPATLTFNQSVAENNNLLALNQFQFSVGRADKNKTCKKKTHKLLRR